MRGGQKGASGFRSDQAIDRETVARFACRPAIAAARVVLARVRRISRPQDFEQVLATRRRASTVHFSVHHLALTPARPANALAYPGSGKLSTGAGSEPSVAVDEPVPRGPRMVEPAAPAEEPEGLWLGMVVPKRYARRSVTRNLIRREIRDAVQQHAPALQGGIWVVRLHAAFDRTRYVSAASSALRGAVRGEIDVVLGRAAALTGDSQPR